MGAHEIQKDYERKKKEKSEIKNENKKKNENNNNRNNQNQKNGNETSFRQNKEIFCHVCREKSHMAPKCKSKNKVAYDDWFINQLKRAQQQSHNQNTEKTDANKIKEKVNESIKKGWYCWDIHGDKKLVRRIFYLNLVITCNT